ESVIATTGTTASASSRSAPHTSRTTSGGVSARSASCSSSSSSSQRSSTARSAASRPPGTATTDMLCPSVARNARWADSSDTTSGAGRPTACIVSSSRSMSREPPSRSRHGIEVSRDRPGAGGASARTTARTAAGDEGRGTGWPTSGGEDLVEDGLGAGLVGLLGQGELGDQDLPRLGQHPLLPGGEPAVLIAAPQVAHDLGDLLHVTGGELLDVGLVTAGPVGGLLGVGLAQHLEDLLEALLVHDVAHADEVD